MRNKGAWLILVCLMVLVMMLPACTSTPATKPPTSAVPTSAAPTSGTPGSTPTTPTSTTTVTAKSQGELVGALQSFGNENWLPWQDPGNAPLHDLFYDMLIYWDHINHKFIPGLAESWEVSPDALTLTYHFRKGVQWQDGWGEFTSADVKFNFEMHASSKSVGKTAATRRIASMDTPDPYTLVVHFKDPYPTFFVDLSLANSAVCQGVVCKKYIETVGEDTASQTPISTGPWKMVEQKIGEYYKFEAQETHWRVVPEFKTVTVRLIPEVSTLIAALKNKEIDAAVNIPADQLTDLKAGGVDTETSFLGGGILMLTWGGMVIPADKRYDAAIHGKDPWTDSRVRKAMAIAIDREAICKAIYSGFAQPASVPLLTNGIEKYKYPYDPAAAKQLLKDAGYSNGFTFKVISYIYPGIPETPRIMEALAGYWQQIGLDPKITVIDYNAYYTKNIVPCKTAGDVSLMLVGPIADMLGKAELFFIPNVVQVVYEDEASYAIYRDNPKMTFDERSAIVDKLNQYYYDSTGPLPIVRVGISYAWNSAKIAPFPHHESTRPTYWEYARHTQPLNTFRLFTPYPGR